MDYLVPVLLTPVAMLLLGVIGARAWTARQLPGGRAILAMAALCGGWLAVVAAELLATTPAATYRLTQAEYLFHPFIPIAWLTFAWTFTRGGDRLPRALLAWLVVVEGAGALTALTNPAHGLIWKSVAFVEAGPLLAMTVEHGPAFYALAVHNWAVVALGSVLILREYAAAYRSTQRLSRWIALGALLPVAANVIYVTGVLPSAMDFTPLATSLSAVAILVGLVRYRLLEYRPVARAALVEGMVEGLLVVDPAGRVVDVNPALQRLLGLTDEVVSRPAAEVIPAPLVAVLDAPAAHAEVDLPAADGTLRHLDVRTSPLVGRSGRTTGRIVLVHDTTDRRAAERGLADANAALAGRNAALDTFVGTVAHGLKNAIHTVHGFAESLRPGSTALSESERDETAEIILRTADGMAETVNALLLLAGVSRQTVAVQPVEMGPVVDAALGQLALQLHAAGAVVDRPDVWPAALGYGPWIGEIWANYLSNALKYGHVPGGPPPHLTLGAGVAPNGHVRYWVRDRGPGLTSDAIATIFEPFTRVHPAAAEGHGLGLAIVRQIAERLDGTCGVESCGVPGEGACFYITLPAAPAGATPPDATADAPRLTWSGPPAAPARVPVGA